jgi:predicted transcriptional regulator
MSLEEWAKEFGLPPALLRKHIESGISGERLIALIKDVIQALPPASTEGIFVTIQGVTKTLREWADKSGLPYSLLYKRLREGVPPEHLLLDPEAFRILQKKKRKEESMKKPTKANPLVTIGEKKKTLREWAKESNIPYITLYQRHRMGWKAEELLLPIGTRRKRLRQEEASPIDDESQKAWEELAVPVEPSRPKRRNEPLKIELDEREWTIAELAEMFGVPKQRIYNRIRQGKTGWQLLFPKDPTYLTMDGSTLLFKEWQEELGYSDKEMVELYQSYQKGFTKEMENEIQKQRKKRQKSSS